MTLTSPFAGLHAVLKATAKKGDYGPLAAHLRAAARGEATLQPDELNLAADIIKPLRRGPHTSPAQQYIRPTKSLTVAGDVLRLSHGYTRGEVAGAVMEVAKKSKPQRGEAWVKGHIKIAKAFLGGQWWQFKVTKFRPK
jgi:hypothetical protein